VKKIQCDLLAEVNEHGVFIYEDCEKVDLQALPKCKATILLAECKGSWYASYDYSTPNGGGGGYPSKRRHYNSREEALQAEINRLVKWLPFPIVRKTVMEEQLSLF
jgi:hypothetical protein